MFFGSTSYCSVSCTFVRSFFRAERATFALKAGVWYRRARFFIFAPDSQAKHACRQAEFPLNALFKIPEPPLFQQAQRAFGENRVANPLHCPFKVCSARTRDTVPGDARNR